MRGTLAIGAAALTLAWASLSLAGDLSGLYGVESYFAEAAPGAVQSPTADKMVQSPIQAGKSLPDDFSCCFQACQYPCVYFQADVLYWDRIGTGCSDVLVIDTDDGSSLLSTDDLDFDGAGGMRFLVGWRPRSCVDCCAWELSYWGLYNWNADAVVTGAGDLGIPGDLGLASNNFFLADRIAADYRSELHNVEMNCVKSCCMRDIRLDFLIGFRYLALNDQLSLIATDLQEGTSSYDIQTHNDLYGLQFGGRAVRPLGCRWGLELTGKAALMFNDVLANQQVTDFPNTPGAFVLRDASDSSDGVAMLAELGIVLIRPLNECWNLRAGYNAIGIGGLALAPDQIDFTATATSGTEIHNTGWIFAHGATLGLERRW